jgi:hypothetical protein
MVGASRSGEEMHLFYWERHHSDFVYQGQLRLVSFAGRTDKPSRFAFKVI